MGITVGKFCYSCSFTTESFLKKGIVSVQTLYFVCAVFLPSRFKRQIALILHYTVSILSMFSTESLARVFSSFKCWTVTFSMTRDSHWQRIMVDILVISDLFPHMNEAWNVSEKIWFHVCFSCLYVLIHIRFVPHDGKKWDWVTWTVWCKSSLRRTKASLMTGITILKWFTAAENMTLTQGTTKTQQSTVKRERSNRKFVHQTSAGIFPHLTQ